MANDDAVREALARLARSSPDGDTTDDQDLPSIDDEPSFHETIDRASAALDDLEAAARFSGDEGLDELAAAIEQAERSVSARAEDGRRALTAFREFRKAAAGVRASEARAGSIDDRGESIGDHFHPGRGSSLGGGDIARSK